MKIQMMAFPFTTYKVLFVDGQQQHITVQRPSSYQTEFIARSDFESTGFRKVELG